MKGEITPQGAKNEALEVICATLLTADPVRIKNIPEILDVNNLIKLLQEIGVKVTRHAQGDFTFQADQLNLSYLDSVAFVQKCASLRGSVLMIGPLLGRFGKATVLNPAATRLEDDAWIRTFWASNTWEPSLFTTMNAMFSKFRPSISRHIYAA